VTDLTKENLDAIMEAYDRGLITPTDNYRLAKRNGEIVLQRLINHSNGKDWPEQKWEDCETVVLEDKDNA